MANQGVDVDTGCGVVAQAARTEAGAMNPTKTITSRQIVEQAKTYIGVPYKFGAEAQPGGYPVALDCSELVELVCRELGVEPRMPDGSGAQLVHCLRHGLGALNMDSAWETAGALLFRREAKSQRIVHVAISTGGGGTIEARGKQYKTVQEFKKRGGFTEAALIPGVTYD